MRFQIIVADPPWGGWKDNLKMSDVKRGAKANYSIMSTQDICSLSIKDISDPDGAILVLWVPSSMLQDGLDVMKSWGFRQTQTLIWAKTKKEPLYKLSKSIKKILKQDTSITIDNLLDNFNYNELLSFGMGRLYRQSHELCLVGINNTKIYKQLNNKSQRSIIFSSNMRHSSKPELLQDTLDKMFPNILNKLELFARRVRTGWICIGNEVCNGEDIKVSLSKL